MSHLAHWMLALALVTSLPSEAPPVASAPPDAPLAVVAAVRGRVDVTPVRRGPIVRATFGRTLARGDRIAVAPGGSLTVFFNDGNVVELGERSVMTIGGRAAARQHATGAAPLAGDVVASVNRFVAGGSRETGLVGLTPLRGGDARALLVSPRRTNLLANRPRFEWRAVPGAVRYRVTLAGEQGELWRREVADTVLAYPADAPALPAGTDVVWDVRALGERDELRHEESVVHVLGDADGRIATDALTRIRDSAGGATSAAAHYLAGSYLFGQGLYEDSAGEFTALVQLEPETAEAHEALGNVYRATGLMDRAAEEYQRALELARRP